jgi:steroid delta-isomerase-like uncharacterized protein
MERSVLEDNNSFAREYLSAWNAHDPERLAELHSLEYEGMDVAQSTLHFGPEGIRQMVDRYCGAFPDLTLMDDSTVKQGEQLALFWTLQATHGGKLMNIPPTGREVKVKGVTLFTLQDGKVQRAWYLWDVAAFLRSVGLLPDL